MTCKRLVDAKKVTTGLRNSLVRIDVVLIETLIIATIGLGMSIIDDVLQLLHSFAPWVSLEGLLNA